MEEIIEKAVEVLRAGGTILYPTDTIWGIGCDAANAEAIEKIYQIKRRDHSKSMLVLAEKAVHWEPEPGIKRPTTYIIDAAESGLDLAPNLTAQDGTIGVRVPRHEFCQKLLHRLGKAIVSTSANFSGEASPQKYEDISERLKASVDYCVPPLPAFESGETQGSRIIKITPEGVIIIRG